MIVADNGELIEQPNGITNEETTTHEASGEAAPFTEEKILKIKIPAATVLGTCPNEAKEE
ncbi:MAG: hypothetical protein WKG06_26610 [Segetibacter sp.]